MCVETVILSSGALGVCLLAGVLSHPSERQGSVFTATEDLDRILGLFHTHTCANGFHKLTT